MCFTLMKNFLVFSSSISVSGLIWNLSIIFSCFIFSPSRLQGQMPLSSSLPISLPLAFSIFFVFLPRFRSLLPGRVTLKLWNTRQKRNLKLDCYSFSRKRMQTSPPWCYTAIGGSLGVGMQLLSSSSTKSLLVARVFSVGIKPLVTLDFDHAKLLQTLQTTDTVFTIWITKRELWNSKIHEFAFA